MIVRLTWQPTGADTPETVTAELPAQAVTNLCQLIAEPTDLGDRVAWIPTRLDTEPADARFRKRLFRLARITAIDPEPTR